MKPEKAVKDLEYPKTPGKAEFWLPEGEDPSASQMLFFSEYALLGYGFPLP